MILGIVSSLGDLVSPAIAEELINKGIMLGGEEREVSILFSDIRNFTSLCEDRTPQEILSLFNKYLSEVNTVIDDYGGVVDKYVGDAVMALFGAPVKNNDDPERAVLAALAMSKSLLGLNRYWAESGGPQLAIGVGVNTAKVVAGNVGSEHRLNYTVIGDGVNLASRLEGITKQYNVDIVVSNSTRVKCPNTVFRELDRVRVKGKHRPVAIFQPLGLKAGISTGQLQTLESYHGALNLFREQSWQQARQLFGELEKEPGLQHLCQLYLQRIEYCLKNPPDDGWDGTMTFNEK